MATKAKVEELFSLPVFVRMFDEAVLPMLNTMAELFLIDIDDADYTEVAAALEPIQRDVCATSVTIAKAQYRLTLTDADVDFLITAYRHPVFAKIQALGPQMADAYKIWYELNRSHIEQQVKTALSKFAS